MNVDIYPKHGAIQGDIERAPLKNGTADYILADNVLEHVIHFDKAWNEIHRILKIEGLLEIRVPYGFNTDPYHIRFFDIQSIQRLIRVGTCGHENGSGPWYRLIGKPKVLYSSGFPWWHLRRYIGIEPRAIIGCRWFGWAREMIFTLQRM